MKRCVVVLLTLCLPVCAQEIYDLLLKGGHVIDPKNGRNRRLDIAIGGKKIKKIAPSIPSSHGRNVVDLADYYITPGLIDLNAYLTPRSTPGGVNPDHNSLRYGVTTVVDAGSAGWKNFEEFKHAVIDEAKVRLLAFLNIAESGLLSPGRDGRLDSIATAQVVAKYPDTIVGVRAMSEQAGAVAAALKAAESSKTIVVADSPDLRPGDIDTQIYGRHAGLMDSHQRIRPSVLSARNKGVLFDASHGNEGLWFRIAAPAIRHGFLPDTISTGMDSRSVMLPRANMTNVLSKFLAMGLTLDQVIERSTASPAKAIKRADVGSLEEGGTADIAVFELRKGSFGFVDSGHARMTADRELRCVLTVRDGEVVWDTEGLSLTDWKKAGPYSNFK